MSYLASVRSREVYGSWDRETVKPRLTLYRIFENFNCYKEDEHNMTAAEEGGVVPLPFSCSYSTQSNTQHVVAVANEDGKVHLINTERRKGGSIKTWQAHVNAVFDIAWVPTENKLVTGSGDQTAQLWDVPTSKCISVFKGHTCSLRSISFKHNHSAVFATGARDGNVMIWDTRTRPLKAGHYKPVNILHGVHTTLPTTGPAQNRRSNSSRNTEAQQSVTTVLFKDENNLYSSGAADGTIKMWDIRRYYTTAKGVLQPRHVYPYVGAASRKHGISALSLTSCGSRLFSSCTDDNIYMYNTHLDTRDPVAVFSGHTISTFYVKSCVTRDNEFLISGSSSHSLFVWDIKHPLLPPVKLDGHSGEVTSVASSSSDLGQIVSCSDDNTVRIWRLNDQISLCKDGFKCGSADRMTTHTPVLMTSLNLLDNKEHNTTPVRPATRTNKITRLTPRTDKGTPKRPDNNNHGNDTTLTPSRVTPNSKFTPTPNRQDKSRLRAIVEDEEAPSSSQDLSSSSNTNDKTPVRSPVRQSPRNLILSTSSTAQQKTPGKISAYFRSNGLLSSEKRKTDQSPLRQSPRLNKTKVSRGGRRISTLELESANKLMTWKTVESKHVDELSSSPKVQNVPSPKKKPKRKEKTYKKSTELIATPTKIKPEDDLVSTSGPKQQIKSPQKISSPCSSRTDPDVSPDQKGTSVATQSGSTVGCSVGTQTLSPLECTSLCKSCCRNFPPLYCAPKSHTPASAVGVGVCTPSTVATDLTPRSCSNSSIPRPKRIHAQSDIPTTPTKGHTQVLKQTSPENKENSEQRVRRKFTKTGTPIHRGNCRCKFCVSSATEFSELSNSPILDMPSRPRKRLLSHEYSAESVPKKRKSLFRSGSEVGSDHTMRSCSPYLDSKTDCEEKKQTGDEAITVTRWLGGKIEDARPLDTEEGEEELEQGAQDKGEDDGEENGSVSGHYDHDHSQCSTLHCIRSYFTKKS